MKLVCVCALLCRGTLNDGGGRRLQFARHGRSLQQYDRSQGDTGDDHTGGASVSQSHGGDQAAARRDRYVAGVVISNADVSRATGGNAADDRDDRDDAFNAKAVSCSAPCMFQHLDLLLLYCENGLTSV